MIKLTTFELRPTAQTSSPTEPIVVGIPIQKGRLFCLDDLRLIREDGAEVPAYFEKSASWPDKSIKWIVIYFQVGRTPPDQTSFSVFVDSNRKTDKEYESGALAIHREGQTSCAWILARRSSFYELTESFYLNR